MMYQYATVMDIYEVSLETKSFCLEKRDNISSGAGHSTF